MPTDGAEFMRRVKYHGKTYTEIKNGSDVGTVAFFGTAGLARILPTKRAFGMIKMMRYAKRVESYFADPAAPDAVLWEYPEAGSYFEEAAASLNMPFDEFLSKVRRMHHAFSLEWKEFADGLPPIKHAARLAA